MRMKLLENAKTIVYATKEDFPVKEQIRKLIRLDI